MVDRPRGSAHPRCPDLICPTDYRYVARISSMDGQVIDVWMRSSAICRIDGILCTLDSKKMDLDIKIVYSCTDQEKREVYSIMNRLYMRALYIPGLP